MPIIKEELLIEILELILESAQHHGIRQKQWTLDQILRKLCQDDYEDVIRQAFGDDFDDDPDGIKYWDTGIAPD